MKFYKVVREDNGEYGSVVAGKIPDTEYTRYFVGKMVYSKQHYLFVFNNLESAKYFRDKELLYEGDKLLIFECEVEGVCERPVCFERVLYQFPTNTVFAHGVKLLKNAEIERKYEFSYYTVYRGGDVYEQRVYDDGSVMFDRRLPNPDDRIGKYCNDTVTVTNKNGSHKLCHNMENWSTSTMGNQIFLTKNRDLAYSISMCIKHNLKFKTS